MIYWVVLTGLVIANGLLLWFVSRHGDNNAKTADQIRKIGTLWRQKRNRRAEAVMVETLVELGWPQVVKKMTAQEVAHRLCIRLAEKLWNPPDVG